MSEAIQEQLEAYIAGAVPQWRQARVTDLMSLSSGWECDVYSISVEHGFPDHRKREDLVLRVYQGSLAYEESAYEFQGMSVLHEAGYPVPRMILTERDRSPFGKPFTVMERIHGREMWPLMFPSPSEVIPEMLDLFVSLFVRLHALDWRPFLPHVDGLDPHKPLVFVERELERWEERVSRFGLPGFLPVIAWLKKHREEVPCEKPSIIHWDFHPGNILIAIDGTGSVIDWTQWDISDARFDLAWTLLLISTQRDAKWREVVLREYEKQAGTRVKGIEYFDVAACAKRLFFVVAAFQDGPEALGLRAEVVSMIKALMKPVGKISELLLERTGMQIPEVERLLEQEG